MSKQSHSWPRKLVLPVLSIIGLYFLLPSSVHAMHIAEGILPANWAIIWSVIAFVFVALGIWFIRKRTREVKGLIPLLGVAGAAAVDTAGHLPQADRRGLYAPNGGRNGVDVAGIRTTPAKRSTARRPGTP